MNLPYFITRRMMAGRQGGFSGFIIRIAVAAIALSIAVMIVTTATVNGFQNEISRKIFNFWGHIRISGYDLNHSYEDLTPISTQQPLFATLDTLPGVRHVQMYANKAGIVKTDTDIEGLVIKGVGPDFDGESFRHYMVGGKLPDFAGDKRSDEIAVSQTTANRLNLKLGDNMVVYFVQDKPLARKFAISGIYNTGLEEYDERYALADIRHIQRLNLWKADEVGGYEVFLTNRKQIAEMTDKINYELAGNDLYTESIQEANPNIFEWLQLQDMNERVIIGLMLLVATINMTTALLILILDRTNMVGILKALGAPDLAIREVFLWNAAYIIGLGLLLGNLIGLGVCLLQKRFGFVRLPEESYYISVAPVEIDWLHIFGLNLGTLAICLIVLVLPTYLVTQINPIKAIRFK